MFPKYKSPFRFFDVKFIRIYKKPFWAFLWLSFLSLQRGADLRRCQIQGIFVSIWVTMISTWLSQLSLTCLLSSSGCFSGLLFDTGFRYFLGESQKVLTVTQVVEVVDSESSGKVEYCIVEVAYNIQYFDNQNYVMSFFQKVEKLFRFKKSSYVFSSIYLPRESIVALSCIFDNFDVPFFFSDSIPLV